MDNTRPKIMVMQAYEDGEVCQFKRASSKYNWFDIQKNAITEPLWDWDTFRYRIKKIEYIFWQGGQCPVFAGTTVEIVMRSGIKNIVTNPEDCIWEYGDHCHGGDIIAYREID